MVQAYREGLLRPSYVYKWGSRLREGWLLRTLEQERDAEMAVEGLHMKAAFGLGMKERGKALSDMLKHLTHMSRYGEGDSSALIELEEQPMQHKMLQELWRAFEKASGTSAVKSP